MRRARGFTLIELMISLALAGLIVAGAMQMHISFNRQTSRQNQVAEMQQNLRVSMLILERAIRSAGHGIDGGVLIERAAAVGAACPLTPTPNLSGNPPGPPTQLRGNYGIKHYAFQWYDKNGFAPPTVTTTATLADGTTTTIDPDWFQVMSAADTPPIYANTSEVNGQLAVVDASKSGGVAPDLSSFKDGELFQIAFPLTDTTGCKGKSCGTWGPLMGCYREISKGTNFGGASSPKIIKHDPANSTKCYNPPFASDECVASLSTAPAHRAVIRHLDGYVTAYRILPVGDASNPTATPKLAMRRAPFGDYSTATAPWQIIADNIENMQLALVMTDGNICYQIDDPAVCEPARAAGVRVTLVARSEVEVAGYREGSPLRYENEAANVNGTTVKDGYLRRAVTSQIELRNMPGIVGPALP